LAANVPAPGKRCSGVLKHGGNARAGQTDEATVIRTGDAVFEVVTALPKAAAGGGSAGEIDAASQRFWPCVGMLMICLRINILLHSVTARYMPHIFQQEK